MNDEDSFKTADPKTVAAVELDLEHLEVFERELSPFSNAIAEAAANAENKPPQDGKQGAIRNAQAVAVREFQATAARIQAQYGVAIGFDKPWAYRPKPKAAYELWKRVIPMFVQTPETLKIGPTALAKLLAKSERNFSVTRDMINAKLNTLAVKEVGRLLASLGTPMIIKKPASIRSIQKQIIESRKIESGALVEEFRGHFKISDDIVHVNGRPYQIQLGASGKRRIKIDGKHWLSLDTIKAFCTKTGTDKF
ncbi:hypothetical protein [Sphingomonas sp. 22R3R2A-7]|uniref:hypothetical protein n=1 Tax=Sphingomonas sp. 22R3R2A-7 TaxID=3050230 RepID=UPI002FE25467